MTPGWDMTTEVVVTGYGSAGATAAIAACDAGSKVLVLEGTAQGGGNTLASFGGFMYPEDPAEALGYLTRLYEYSRSERDDQLLRVFVEESSKTIDWLKNLRKDAEVGVYGGASYPKIAGANGIRKYVVKGKNKGTTGFAQNLWQLLSQSVEEERKIPVMTQTPAKRLVTNGSGEVMGVIAQARGKEVSIRAKRGVILATGGYEFDPATLQNHVKGFPVYSLGHPGNRGDGVRMAQKVGARLWHMNCVSCAFGIKVPEYEPALLVAAGNAGQILVDKSGRRFADEGSIEWHAGLLTVDLYDSHSLTYPRIPCYLVFDEKTRKRGPVPRVTGMGSAGISYSWSKDNSAEIKNGWILMDDTLEGLAEKLGIDGRTLKDTAEQWNADVRAGKDTLFGRKMPNDGRSSTIEDGPFYAAEIYPCLLNTHGGPKRNGKAEVVDVFDAPIPGLYSAGELGSMWGLIYQGGGNIAECLAFGRIAGRNAGSRPAACDGTTSIVSA